MNARVPIRIVSPSCQTATVSPWGFRMECDFDFDAGEPAIWSPIDRAHPGTPPNAELIACRVGGVDITEMLDGFPSASGSRKS
jgi:hypothetical protein